MGLRRNPRFPSGGERFRRGAAGEGRRGATRERSARRAAMAEARRGFSLHWRCVYPLPRARPWRLMIRWRVILDREIGINAGRVLTATSGPIHARLGWVPRLSHRLGATQGFCFK